MKGHHFILTPGHWYGEGKIQLNMIEEELLFQTTWNVSEKESSGRVQCVQQILIDGLSDDMKNDLTFFDITENSFSVEMSNHNIERVQGTGIIDNKMIAWEFKDAELNFEGFEVFYLEEDGGYRMHAEYVTSDQFRTKILGRIWKKSTEEKLEIKDKEQGDEL